MDDNNGKNIGNLYNLVEVKLEVVADKLLLSKINNDDNIMLNVQSAIEKVFIKSAMKLSKRNISKAAKLLGINRNTLSKKLKELKVESEV